MAVASHTQTSDTDQLFQRLCRSQERDLRELFKAATKPNIELLNGYAFKGFNVTSVAKVLGFQKFVKCFFTTEAGGQLEGCNLWVSPFSPEGEWILQKRKPHGFYVVKTEWDPVWGPSQKNALRIDYAASVRNHRLNPERAIIDYLVQPDPENPDCFLGKAFLGSDRLKVFFSYFVLARLDDSDQIFEEKLSSIPIVRRR
ncbi:MAG: hypothetical protein C4318_02165 [Acidimicrobiia bacterium]